MALGDAVIADPPPATEWWQQAVWGAGEWVITDRPLAVVSAAHKAAATTQYRGSAVAGTTVTVDGAPVRVETTHDARNEIAWAAARAAAGSPPEVVTRSGVRLIVTEAMAAAMLTAVDNHLAACLQREADLYAEIDAAATAEAVAAIDVTAGWP